VQYSTAGNPPFCMGQRGVCGEVVVSKEKEVELPPFNGDRY
jgi:hypothetical protein